MSRTPLALIVLAAACGAKSPGPVGNVGGEPSGSKLEVVLVDDAADGDDMGHSPTLGPAAGSEFPAVSADGTTIVHLVQDAEDFTGVPIATVVFWTRGGAAASFELASAIRAEMPVDQAQKEQDAVTQINAKLAETSWSPISTVEATGEDPDTGAPNRLELDGAVIELSQIADQFRGLGSGPEGEDCGEVIGLQEGFGSKALGFAVVFPRVTLGGDDCWGATSASYALVVPL